MLQMSQHYESEFKKKIIRLRLEEGYTIISICKEYVMIILWYVKRKIIVPIERIRQVPCELAKGNGTIHLTVEKNKYFGYFVWGFNLLEEHLEQQKKWCFSMQKEKSR